MKCEVEQSQKYRNWRKNIQTSQAKKGQWLQPRNSYNKNIAAKTEHGVTTNKEETAFELKRHWFKLMHWTDQKH